MRSADLDLILRANPARWARRDQRDSLKAFISAQKTLLKSPRRKEADFVRMARAEFLFGEYFSVESKEKREHFAESANWAEMALLENPEYRRGIDGPHPEKAIYSLGKKNMEGLFWHAYSLSKWAELMGVGTSLRYRNRIQGMMERVNQLRPDYFHGGAHRYFGIHFARQPGLNEEDLALSRKHFEQALRSGPDFFSNHVSFAGIYGKKIENPALIKKHLEIAARGEPGTLPGFKPEQILEQKRARKILEGETP
ncbi:MAG: TRAP transporter TatT component family protein [Bdellovibrionales bacterium]|nr:TRAP transporter TatT component family protein [Bdellovibrionales bacterium]